MIPLPTLDDGILGGMGCSMSDSSNNPGNNPGNIPANNPGNIPEYNNWGGPVLPVDTPDGGAQQPGGANGANGANGAGNAAQPPIPPAPPTPADVLERIGDCEHTEKRVHTVTPEAFNNHQYPDCDFDQDPAHPVVTGPNQQYIVCHGCSGFICLDCNGN